MSKRIKIAISKTINLGNYESAKIEVGIERDLKDGAFEDEELDIDFVNLFTYVESCEAKFLRNWKN